MPALFTSGPWEVVDDHPNRSSIRITSGDQEVCVLYGPDGQPDGRGIWSGDHIRMANARLIAAAPAMLRALQDIEAAPKSLTKQQIRAVALAAVAAATRSAA